MAIRNPPIDVAAIDAGGRFTKDWYDRFKYLDTLQPLSDVDFTAVNAAIALKSNITRSINQIAGSTYTFVAGDAGNVCQFYSASAVTATIPPNSSVPFPFGTQIDLIQTGTGKVTLAQGSGVTIVSITSYKSLSAQYAAATLLKLDTNVWQLSGSLIA
ncbi:MAG: hypothetical protein G4V63_30570 [Candidatus Afipia apatlaquensis]|uniref:Uncharacterized protein n=1 Tax=Candidatus Afipia apatlaquensis TaxID=2712852 RepID=A0A7C9RK04_9BRAD|nr:hypothetical protein [Candidatus Afipia apatlaquensis]